MTNTPLELPILLMAIVAPIGALDVFWFHLYRFRLYAQPGSRAETVTHIARGLLFALGLLAMLTWRPVGTWYWVVGGLFVLDFANNVADVLLEPSSRRPLGGLPPLEYLIHVVGATAAGGITAAYFIAGWQLRLEDTALVPLAGDALPAMLRWQGWAAAAGGLLVALLEAVLLARSVLASRRGPHLAS